jgi:thioester reductase-like protein
MPVPGSDKVAPDAETLLTGATGFFGAFLLTELLATTPAPVNCLVRAKDETHARQRIRQNLLRYHRWDPALADRVTVTVGNLAEPRLGLDDETFADLAARTGEIYHNGATVNHLLPLSHLEAANVRGTETLLELADATAARTLHYLSANAVADGHDTGYAESKRRSEQKVLAAAADGIAATVYRLPRIAPDTWTGIPNENDITIRLINLILQVGSAPDITFTEIWVAADVAASAIVATANRAGGGETYSLWSEERVSMPYLLDVAEEAGFRIPLQPLDEWLERVHTLNASEHEVTLGVLGMDDANIAEPGDGLGDDRYGDLVAAPRITRSALIRYFDRCRAGF